MFNIKMPSPQVKRRKKKISSPRIKRQFKTLYIEKKRKTPMPHGKRCNLDSSYQVFEKQPLIIRYKKDPKKIFAILLPNILTKQELEVGRNLIRYKKQTNSRKMAAGIDQKKMADLKKRGMGTYSAANIVHSSIVGYAEDSHFSTCRQTKLYRENRDFFNIDTMRLIQRISQLYQEYAPENYKKQKEFIKKINQNMVLPQTVYTTATVNVDFQTRTHQDQGDFDSGLGNLIVFQERGKKWSGSEFMMPDFKVAFRLHEGDVLFANVHETHCNAKRKGNGRISLVLYARKGLERKCLKTTKKVLEEGPMHKYLGRKKSKTRK